MRKYFVIVTTIMLFATGIIKANPPPNSSGINGYQLITTGGLRSNQGGFSPADFSCLRTVILCAISNGNSVFPAQTFVYSVGKIKYKINILAQSLDYTGITLNSVYNWKRSCLVGVQLDLGRGFGNSLPKNADIIVQTMGTDFGNIVVQIHDVPYSGPTVGFSLDSNVIRLQSTPTPAPTPSPRTTVQ